MRTSIVIPCYNEAETIGRLVADLMAYGRVIVVDDGSTDDTGQIAWDAGAAVITHRACKGIGPSIRDGFAHATDAERIVVMDAGGSHSVSELPMLLDEDAEVVIGSRFVTGGRYIGGRQWRRLASKLAAFLCNFAQRGSRVRDWSSGFRVYSQKAVEAILGDHQQAQMHAWQIETLGLLRKLGLSIAEVPITYRAGRSSLRLSIIHEMAVTWLVLVHHRGIYR